MNDIRFNFQPVIVIGAARSGTNMLRDMLTRLPGVTTWPCDEINYIWRHQNASIPHDEFTPGHARPSVCRYVRGAFQQRSRRGGCRFLVEKTCANSLRVRFVDAVIPEAKFIFLVRDGRDVVASAVQRWTAPLEFNYLLKKSRFVPPSDLPFYAARYFLHRAYRLFSAQKRLSTWGPRFVGMPEMLATRTLEEVCAAQWARSVDSATRALDGLEPERVIQLKYETLVRQPQQALTTLLDYLGITEEVGHVCQATSHVSTRSIGNWQRRLSSDAVLRIAPIVEPQLTALGYATNQRVLIRAAA